VSFAQILVALTCWAYRIQRFVYHLSICFAGKYFDWWFSATHHVTSEIISLTSSAASWSAFFWFTTSSWSFYPTNVIITTLIIYHFVILSFKHLNFFSALSPLIWHRLGLILRISGYPYGFVLFPVFPVLVIVILLLFFLSQASNAPKITRLCIFFTFYVLHNSTNILLFLISFPFEPFSAWFSFDELTDEKLLCLMINTRE